MLTRGNALIALALYWIAAIVFLAGAIVVMPAGDRGEEDSSRIGGQVVNMLDGVVIRVLNADAAFRLFLLSGEPDDLGPVERARDDLTLELEAVRHLAGDDTGVKTAVEALLPEIDAKLTHMATLIERRRADAGARIAGAELDIERAGTRKIRERVDIAIENVLRAIERDNLNDTAGEAKRRLAVIGATAVVVLLGLFLTLRLRRSFETA
jgi:CHASE3 domain sensor protein